MERKHNSRKRGVVLTAEGLRKLQAARRQAELADNFGDRYTLEELSDRTGISLKTVSKVLEAHNTVDKPTLEAFFQTFQIVLERQDYRYPSNDSDAQTSNSSQVFLQSARQPKRHIDWGEAPDVSLFYGRQAELLQLKEWIDTDNEHPRRLIAILGMGGVGKTALATKLLHDVIDNVEDCPFEYVIWRSLRNAPTLETILMQWLAILSNQQETQPSLQTLLHYLQHYRCLLMLDNLESVLSKKAGMYRQGYESYGELFRLVGETSHQSSLIVTSREKTIELSTLEGDHFPVCCLSLKGSNEASQYLLQAKGLKGTTEQQKQLCDRYSNSPLAIKIIAATIQDLFDGEIGTFLQEETMVFHGIRRLLDQQFERLSNSEQTIMFWLAINRDWTAIDELDTDLVPATARGKILEAIESLHWRNLIEKKQGTYTQQPVVMEYVIELLIEQISAELLAMNEQPPILLHRYPLLKTTVKDYIRDSQQRLIVEAIARELQANLGSQLAIAQHLKACLAMLRPDVTGLAEFIPESSYAAGNILNLLCYLGSDLRGCDCSGLSVQHAYLPNVPLPYANFAHADLQRSQLTDGFGAVLAVAFTSDGGSFISGELGGYLRRWRVNDRQAIWAVKAYNSRVHSIAVSPDDTIIAVGTTDHSIEFWDVTTGQQLRSLVGHQDQVYCVAFHPTQPLLASTSGDMTIRLWDIETGTFLYSFEGKDGHTDQVLTVCFSPKGDYLISGSSDRTIKIWDLTTQELRQTLTGHEDQVFSVSVHPNGNRFTSGSPDGTLKLWQIDPQTFTASPVHTVQSQTAHIFSVLSPDGSLLASSCADHTIRLWDSETMQPVRTLQAHNNWIRAIQFSPDGQTLLSGDSDYTIKLWDISSGQVLKTWLGYSNWIWAVDVSRDGTKIVSGGGDRTVRVWDLATGACLQSLRGHRTWVLAVACNQDGSLVASGGGDSDLTLWQTSSGKVIKTLTGHTTQIYSLLFSPTNDILASGSGDYSIRLWDVASGQVLKVLQGHQDWIRSMNFSPDGKLLVSAGQDLRVNLWDVHTGECLRTWQDFDTWVWGVSFHPDGDRLVTASGHIPKLWDVRTGALIQSYQGAAKRIRSVAISPNGQWLAAGGQDNAIHLWDLETGEMLTTFLGHAEQVLSVKFSSDNCSLISGSADETIKIWNIQTGLHQTLKAERLYEGMNITGVKGLSEEAIATLIKLGAKLGD
ncbi:NACHT domain-containing protein [Phormidium tenue FACHB-886]|nr:NACHT domain-containing protein [Phormidium tenue FACHB-886]